VGGVVSLFYVERLKIKDVIVEGVETVNRDALVSEVRGVLNEKTLWFIPKDRLFLLPKEEIKSVLTDKFIKIKTVELPDKFNQALIVLVKERKPRALLCDLDNKNCAFLDETGFVYEEAPFFSSGIFPIFTDHRDQKPVVGGFLLGEKETERVLRFINTVEEKHPVSRVCIKEGGVYEIYTEIGWYLILESEDDWELVYDNLTVSLSELLEKDQERLDYIDLRFGNKVFYKWK
jgi:hypothetical protein